MINRVISIQTTEDVKNLIRTLEKGVYSGKSVDDEDIIIYVGENGININTVQSNNWIRESEYDNEGELISQGYSRNQ